VHKSLWKKVLKEASAALAVAQSEDEQERIVHNMEQLTSDWALESPAEFEGMTVQEYVELLRPFIVFYKKKGALP
jgi:hypothetical protein